MVDDQFVIRFILNEKEKEIMHILEERKKVKNTIENMDVVIPLLVYDFIDHDSERTYFKISAIGKDYLKEKNKIKHMLNGEFKDHLNEFDIVRIKSGEEGTVVEVLDYYRSIIELKNGELKDISRKDIVEIVWKNHGGNFK